MTWDGIVTNYHKQLKNNLGSTTESKKRSAQSVEVRKSYNEAQEVTQTRTITICGRRVTDNSRRCH